MSKVLFLLLVVGYILEIATTQEAIYSNRHSVTIPRRRTTNNHTIESLGETPLELQAAVSHSHARQSVGITGHSVHIPKRRTTNSHTIEPLGEAPLDLEAAVPHLQGITGHSVHIPRRTTNNHTIDPLGESPLDLQPSVPHSHARQSEGITGHSVHNPGRTTNNHTTDTLGEAHLDLQSAVPHSRASQSEGITGDVIPSTKIWRFKWPKWLSWGKGSSNSSKPGNTGYAGNGIKDQITNGIAPAGIKAIVGAGFEGVTGGDGSGSGGSGTSSNVMESSTQKDSTIQQLPMDRSLLRLRGMMKCGNHCSPWAYNGYGCYCGFGGSGAAVDGIDECCKGHDSCYGDAGECNTISMYTRPYKWTCNGGKPYCGTKADPLGEVKSCGDQLCQCDLQFVECLKQFPCPKTQPECNTSTSWWPWG